MTIKQHIMLSILLSLSFIIFIACHNKNQNIQYKDSIKSKSEQNSNKNNNVNELILSDKINNNDNNAGIKQSDKSSKEDVNELMSETGLKSMEKNNGESKNENNILKEEKQYSKNLLANGDFSDGLSKWDSNKSIALIEEEGKKYIEITGRQNGQNRICQTINTISGHVYRLSFKAKADQKDAFAIFRDFEKDKERYLYTNPSKDWKEYSKEFQSYKDGEYRIFLSCFGEGKFYFSDACIVDITE